MSHDSQLEATAATYQDKAFAGKVIQRQVPHMYSKVSDLDSCLVVRFGKCHTLSERYAQKTARMK